jgi:hypothetical protein
MSIEAALTALAAGPVIAGINWYDSFDEPVHGMCVISDGAQVRGGHEICLDELDVERGLVGFTNSWGEGWGEQGRGYFTWHDFTRLLKEEGDVTVFIPVTEPAPFPVPPGPAPAPVDVADQALAAAARPWVTHRHSGNNARFAEAVQAWLDAKGL